MHIYSGYVALEPPYIASPVCDLIQYISVQCNGDKVHWHHNVGVLRLSMLQNCLAAAHCPATRGRPCSLEEIPASSQLTLAVLRQPVSLSCQSVRLLFSGCSQHPLFISQVCVQSVGIVLSSLCPQLIHIQCLFLFDCLHVVLDVTIRTGKEVQTLPLFIKLLLLLAIYIASVMFICYSNYNIL